MTMHEDAIWAHVRAVVFDFGGTLVDVDYDALGALLEIDSPVPRSALAHVQRALDAHVSDAVARGLRPRSLETIVAALAESMRVALPPDAVAQAREAHRSRSLWRVVNADVVPMARRLRAAGLRLGVLSNGDGRVESDVAALGLADCFEFVIDSAVVGVAKPLPGIFAIAEDRLGLHRSHIAYVGDLPSVDVAGARAAGWTSVLLDPHDAFAPGAGRSLHAPDARIRELAALPLGTGG